MRRGDGIPWMDRTTGNIRRRVRDFRVIEDVVALLVMADVVPKLNDALKEIPTIILTTSQADADVLKSYQLQANCFLSKPVQLDAFESLVRSINDFWLTKVKLTHQEHGG